MIAAHYLTQAARCRRQARQARDHALRTLLEEERSLWLMLARESLAIEAMVRSVETPTNDD